MEVQPYLVFHTPPPVIWSDPTVQPTYQYQRVNLNALHTFLDKSTFEHQQDKKDPGFWIRVLYEVDTVMSEYLQDVLKMDEFSCDLPILTDALLLPKFIDGLLYLTSALLIATKQARESCNENPLIYETIDHTFAILCVRGMSRVGSILRGLRCRAQADNISMITNNTEKSEMTLKVDESNQVRFLADDNESFKAFGHCLASMRYLNSLEESDFDPILSSFPETQQHLISLYYFHKQYHPNDYNSVPLFYSPNFLSKMQQIEKLKTSSTSTQISGSSRTKETTIEPKSPQNLAWNTDNDSNEKYLLKTEVLNNTKNADNQQNQQELPSKDDGNTRGDNNEETITEPSIRIGTLLPPLVNFTLMANCEHTLFHLCWSLTIILSIEDCYSTFVTLSTQVPIIHFIADAFNGSFTDNPIFMSQMVSLLSVLFDDGEEMCSFIVSRLSLPPIISKLALYAMSPIIDPDNPLKSLLPRPHSNFDFLHRVLCITNHVLRLDDLHINLKVFPIFSFLTSGIAAAFLSDAMYSWLFLQHVETVKIKTIHTSSNAETIAIRHNDSPLHITSIPFNAIFNQQQLEIVYNQLKQKHPNEKHVVCYSAMEVLLTPSTPESHVVFELLREVMSGVLHMVYFVNNYADMDPIHPHMKTFLRETNLAVLTNSLSSFCTITRLCSQKLCSMYPTRTCEYLFGESTHLHQLFAPLLASTTEFSQSSDSILVDYCTHAIGPHEIMEEWLNTQNKAFVNTHINPPTFPSCLLQGSNLSSSLLDTLVSVQTAYLDITKIYLWAASCLAVGIYHHTQYTLLHTNFIHLLSHIITSRYIVRTVYLTHPQSEVFYTPESNLTLLNSAKKAGPVTFSLALQSHQLASYYFQKKLQIYLAPLILQEVTANRSQQLRDTPHNQALSFCSPYLYQLGPAIDNKVANEMAFAVSNWLQNYIDFPPNILEGIHFIPMALTIKYNFARVMGQYTSMMPLYLDAENDQEIPPNLSLHLTTNKTWPPRYIMNFTENIPVLFTPIQYLHSLYQVLSHQSQTGVKSKKPKIEKYGFLRESPMEYCAPLVKCYVEAIIRVMQGLCYAHADQVSISTKKHLADETFQLFLQVVKKKRVNALDNFEEDSEDDKPTSWNDVADAAQTTHTLDDVIELSNRAAIIPDCFHNVRIPECALINNDLPKIWTNRRVKKNRGRSLLKIATTSFEYVYTSSLNDEYNIDRKISQNLSFDAFALLTECCISYLVDLLLEGYDLCEVIFNDSNSSSSSIDGTQNEPLVYVTPMMPSTSKSVENTRQNEFSTLFQNISDQILTAQMDYDNIYQVLPFIDTMGHNGHIDFNQSQFISNDQNPYLHLANSFKIEDLCTFGPQTSTNINNVPSFKPTPFPITVTEVEESLNPAVLEFVNKKTPSFSHVRTQVTCIDRIFPSQVDIKMLMQDFASNSIRNERHVVISSDTPNNQGIEEDYEEDYEGYDEDNEEDYEEDSDF